MNNTDLPAFLSSSIFLYKRFLPVSDKAVVVSSTINISGFLFKHLAISIRKPLDEEQKKILRERTKMINEQGLNRRLEIKKT